MHLLPPQVELDSLCLVLTLATLAIAALICSLPAGDARR
jgi:hypothetical protein